MRPHSPKHEGHEAQVIVEAWRVEYNTERPHSALGGHTPDEYAHRYGTRATARLAEAGPGQGVPVAISLRSWPGTETAWLTTPVLATRGAQMSRLGGGARRALAALAGAAVVAAGLVAITTSPAAATVYNNVTTELGVNGLRAAWADPNATQIDLGADITLVDCSSNFGEVTRVNPTTDVTLNGHGFTVRQTCPTAGVFGQNGGHSLTFQNVTITGGHQDNTTTCYGGGIRTSAPVTITNSTVSKNSAPCAGGGISVASSLTVTNSTVSGNTTDGEGGGIFQSDTSSPLTVTNSTVSGNTTTGDNAGGGIRAFGTATLVYATVVDNTGTDGANVSGYVNGGATLTSFGSVIALPQGGGTNCSGFVSKTSNGFNFTDDISCGFTATETHLGVDPRLGPLANNGGSTLTRLPQSGSPLIDAIPVASCGAMVGIGTDQRGVTRPQGPGCDIGAVEVQVAEPAPAPAAVVITPKFTG